MRISLSGIKLLFTRPMRNKSPIHLESGVFGIILVAFYSFDPFGIGDDDPDASLLQDIKGRNPILPSGLYTNIHAVVLMEPVGKAVQVRIEH